LKFTNIVPADEELRDLALIELPDMIISQYPKDDNTSVYYFDINALNALKKEVADVSMNSFCY
ncbi:hypothetical protein HAX54_028899, partial [Datura stramonium]|nr:hypothetical protein [Datura stramonium]